MTTAKTLLLIITLILTPLTWHNVSWASLGSSQEVPPLNCKKRLSDIEDLNMRARCYTYTVLGIFSTTSTRQINNEALSSKKIKAEFQNYCDVVDEYMDVEDITTHVMGYATNRKGKKGCIDCIWRSSTKEQQKQLLHAFHSGLSERIRKLFDSTNQNDFTIKKASAKKITNKLVAFNVPIQLDKKNFYFIIAFKKNNLDQDPEIYNVGFSIGSLRGHFMAAYRRKFKELKKRGTAKSAIDKIIETTRESTRVVDGKQLACDELN